ncbi:transcription factor A, mitochondrial-like [Babylonia areolata]|uniref:transcription factor A, mitochondrial-like n=1 Tax=Babylonia areolata TaxID=304850 RepID=UPI003FD4D2C7
MAVKAACARALSSLICRRLPLPVFSAHASVQQWRSLVHTSQYYLSPQPPKKPPGAFVKFMTNKSAEITRLNPGATIGERSKIASQMWNSLNPEERNRLKLLAREDLKSYRENYLIFLDRLSDQERDQFMRDKKTKRMSRAHRRHKMELRKFGKPKMPANPFMLFVRSSRLERGNTPPTQFMKGLVEYWKDMPQEEKEIYQEDSRQERARYQQEMLEWEERMREIGREDLIRKKSQKRTKKVVSTKAKKKKAPTKRKTKSKGKSSKKSPSSAKTTKKRTITRGMQTEE